MTDTITLEKLIDKGLAIRKGTWYYLSAGNGVSIGSKLGQTSEGANAKIAAMVKNGELDSLLSLGNTVAPETENGTPESPGIDLQPSQKPTDDNSSIDDTVEINDKFANIMGKIQDLKPELSGSMQGVFVDGVDVREEEHPTIKKFPFHVRWRDRANNVKNGSSFMNKGYTVFLKTWEEFKQSPCFLTTNRDDTPEESYITSGQNVLCILRKSNFKERKEAQRLRNMETINSVSEARQLKAQNLALQKDPTVSLNAFASDNQAQVSSMASQMGQQGKSQAEIGQAINKFEKFSQGETTDL